MPAAASAPPPRPHDIRGSSLLLLLVIFVEGFSSLGIEVIALRRLVPQLGSSITVTAPTIGLFLLALAAGYHTGGRADSGYGRRVLRNFLLASAIAGIGLSSVSVQVLFDAFDDPVGGYLAFMGLVVCPSAWLLAQTVPLLANLMPQQRVGAASAAALTASTAGSVLGALVLSLVVMQRLGVSAAVLLCAAALALAAPLAACRGHRAAPLLPVVLLLVLLSALNLQPGRNALETAYADYRTVSRQPLAEARPGATAAPSRVLLVNNQLASRLDAGDPPRRSAYIERMQHLLLQDLQLNGKQVLVLGAGGFTLSGEDRSNRYTFVDIDPAIRALAERDFLGQPINGRFEASDARRFVERTDERFDAIVVDAYSAHASVPAHLVTLEFFHSLRRPLADGGAVLLNLILDSRLQSDYARNLLATLEAALGRCEVEVLQRAQAVSNVVVLCRPARTGRAAPQPYTDERNRVELDRGILGY